MNDEHYSSLAEMTGAADLVAVGTVVGIRRDPMRHTALSASDGAFGELEFVTTQVLSGTVESDGTGSIRLEFYVTDPQQLARFEAGLPTGQVIVFLRNKAVEAAANGWPLDGPDTGHLYYRVVSNHGVIRDEAGTAVAPGAGGCLADVNKEPFDTVTATVLAAARPAAGAQSPTFTAEDFWTKVGPPGNGERFDSVAAMRDAADVVVFAKPVSISPGPDYKIVATGETQYNATIHLAIRQVIAGAPIAGTLSADGGIDIVFVVSFNEHPDLDALLRSLPMEDVILFLDNAGKVAEELGAPSDAPDAGAAYYFVTSPQAVLRVVSGTIRPLSTVSNDWLVDLRGKDVPGVIDLIAGARA